MRILFILALLLSASAQAATVVDERLAAYKSQGAGEPSAERGAALWSRERMEAGRPRSCATCHGTDLRREGKHATTGKLIEPLAPAANPKRLTSSAEVEKWFQRNCDWTLGRACTPQEKADLLAFIAGSGR